MARGAKSAGRRTVGRFGLAPDLCGFRIERTPLHHTTTVIGWLDTLRLGAGGAAVLRPYK
jgi:hypothetical protein